ncbi:hypothetical protein [Fibrisoma montanum]|uniref:hypothetical protein n=1 Tax=Fibrisoma montanum TaxID=2305895 RepID=UPI001314ED13|nr:hypothetical protein [Fibrisoma montanum]
MDALDSYFAERLIADIHRIPLQQVRSLPFDVAMLALYAEQQKNTYLSHVAKFRAKSPTSPA